MKQQCKQQEQIPEQFQEVENLYVIEQVEPIIENHYRRLRNGDILKQLWQDISVVETKTSLSKYWSFMLYEKCSWNMFKVDQLLTNQKDYKSLINYNPNFTIEIKQSQQCTICYQIGPIWRNSCGHGCCVTCWNQILKVCIQNEGRLIGDCFEEQCQEKINYLLIEQLSLLQNKSATGDLEDLQKKCNRMISINYSQNNKSLRICHNRRCSAEYMIDTIKIKPIICQCGYYMCTICSKQFHYPLQCFELKKWETIRIKQPTEEDWKTIFEHKNCPKCNKLIEKNKGCNHIKCICEYQFCWVCLKGWESHTQKCTLIENAEQISHQIMKALNNQQTKTKLHQTKQQVQRIQRMIDRIDQYNMGQQRHYISRISNLSATSLLFLPKAATLIHNCFEFWKNCLIYSAITLPENLEDHLMKQVMRYGRAIFSTANRVDNFLIKVHGYTQKIMPRIKIQESRNVSQQEIAQAEEILQIFSTQLKVLFQKKSDKTKDRLKKLNQALEKVYKKSYK